jgi:hypothetical protein
VSRLIFYTGVATSGRFGHSSPVGLRPDFSKAGFHWIIGIDQVIIRAG